MYTHCPNCNTHFSITQEYLDIANGKVRCGKCDYVFNALENLYNETETNSPQLEAAVSTTEEEQTASAEITTEDSVNTDTDDNNIPPEPETIAETPETPVIEAETDTEQTESVEIQAPFTPPLASIDIKEKMERIAASLSAATQELKNARKSVGFERANTADVAPTPVSEETNTESPLAEADTRPDTDNTPETINEAVTETENQTAVAATDDAELQAAVSAEDIADSSSDSETETQAVEKDETEEFEEDTAEINALEIIAAETDEAAETHEADAELTETVTAAEPPPMEDELDLVDYSEQQETEESVPRAAIDFDLPPVDESDIDILNSLIENQEHEDIAPDSLIEELNDINKSLSSESISLDDELNQIENSLDQELDNGDDILTELEQLENEFNSVDAESKIQTDKDSDEFDNEPESTSVQESSPSDQKQDTDIPVVEEEIVPSFLTQNSSKSSSPARMFGWLFATLLMLGLLATQYLHFNSMKLADNPDFRPFLETLCPITGCILPLRKAPDKIITTSHDVHTHPSVNDALEIQLSFRNKAGFTQPYPILEVIFSNPRGEIIARRKFSPDEYLKSNTSYVSGIKPNQTEKVDLQIVDPDPGALLSFQFNYL